MDHATYHSKPLIPPTEEASLQAFIDVSARHQQTIVDYYALALQATLSEDDEARLEDILMQATEDPLLSFWLDEADYWVAHHRRDLDDEAIAQQQEKLKRVIGQTWVDSLWSDLQNGTKALQAYLQRLGLYAGAIDGIMGPNTRSAVELFQKGSADKLPLEFTGG